MDVLQREINQMRGGIDGNGVGMGHLEGADAGEPRAGEMEDGDGAGFSGDVEALEAGIEGKDVGVVADFVFAEHFHGGEIDDGEGVIGFTGDEGQMGSVVEGDAVRVGDAGKIKAMGDDGACGVYGDELVEMVDGDEDVAGAGIVDGVAGSAAEGNFGDEAIGAGIDDGVDAAVLVGDEDAVLAGRVGDAVRVVDGAGASDDLEGTGIDGEDLMLAGGGGVDAMQPWHDEDAVHAAEAGKIGDDFAGTHIEDNEVAGVHVRNVEKPRGGIEGLIVEANRRAGHGDVGDERHAAAGDGMRLS